MNSTKILILLALIGCAMSEVVNHKPCKINDCSISEVRVVPCDRDSANEVCKIRRRKPANMAVDFTPDFDADTLEASLVWVTGAEQELPLITMDKEVCKYTSCPFKSGEKQTYQVDIPIEAKFPLNTYNIKWTFKAASGKQCCYMHEIKLIR